MGAVGARHEGGKERAECCQFGGGHGEIGEGACAVQVADALSILRISLGLQDAPGWTFIDPTADLSGVTRNAVPVFSGLDLDPLAADADVELTGILLGNIDNFDFV